MINDSWIFKNSPFEILNIAFKRLFSNIKYNAYFEPNIEQHSDGDTIYGLTNFDSNGEITILIDANLIDEKTEFIIMLITEASVFKHNATVRAVSGSEAYPDSIIRLQP